MTKRMEDRRKRRRRRRRDGNAKTRGTFSKTGLVFEGTDEFGGPTRRQVYEDARGRKFVRILTRYVPIAEYSRRFAKSQLTQPD